MRFADYELDSVVQLTAAGALWNVTRPDGTKALGCLRSIVDAERLAKRWNAWADVDSPHVVRLLDVVTEDETQVLCLFERVEGRTLEALLAAGTLDKAARERIAGDLETGVRALHGAGLVHGDLAPANVVVRPDGHAVIVDLVDDPDDNAGTAGWSGGGAIGTEGDLAALARIHSALSKPPSRGANAGDVFRDVGTQEPTRPTRRRSRSGPARGGPGGAPTAIRGRLGTVATVLGVGFVAAAGILAIGGLGGTAEAGEGRAGPVIAEETEMSGRSRSWSGPGSPPEQSGAASDLESDQAAGSHADQPQSSDGWPVPGDIAQSAAQEPPAACPEAPEIHAVLAEIVARRDRALAAGDVEELAAVEGGDLLEADAAALDRWAAAGVGIRNLSTEVAPPDELSCAGEKVQVQTTIRHLGYERCDQAGCAPVDAGETHQMTVHLRHDENGWRAVAISVP